MRQADHAISPPWGGSSPSSPDRFISLVSDTITITNALWGGVVALFSGAGWALIQGQTMVPNSVLISMIVAGAVLLLLGCVLAGRSWRRKRRARARVVRQRSQQADASQETTHPALARLELDKVSFGDLDADAEHDENPERLRTFFIPPAGFSRLIDGQKSIVEGRKGTGKTHTLIELEHGFREDHPEGLVIPRLPVQPRDLCEVYSDAITQEVLSGLWQHVLAVRIAQRVVPDQLDDSGPLSEDLLLRAFAAKLSDGTTGEAALEAMVASQPGLRSALFDAPHPPILMQVDGIDKHFFLPSAEGTYSAAIVVAIHAALCALQAEFKDAGTTFVHVMAVRSEIPEQLLVGKGLPADECVRLDSSRDLEQMIETRIRVTANARAANAVPESMTDFGDIWACLAEGQGDVRETWQLALDLAHRRPRYLIELLCEAQASVSAPARKIGPEHLRAAREVIRRDMCNDLSESLAIEPPVTIDAAEALEAFGASFDQPVPYRSIFGEGMRRLLLHLIWWGYLGVEVGVREQYSYEVDFDPGTLRELVDRAMEGRHRLVLHRTFRS